MDPQALIRSFKQDGAGNCVSIAIIKAGIEVFGLGKVIHAEKIATGYRVTMRDGFSFDITNEEIQIASKGSKFKLLENREVFDYANFCFGAMAKRAQIEENDDFQNMTFEKAIATLNDGEYYTYGPHFLGLRHNYRHVGRRYIFHYPGVVGASIKHCFFASYGWEDKYGTPDYIGLLERRTCNWFRLTTEQVY